MGEPWCDRDRGVMAVKVMERRSVHETGASEAEEIRLRRSKAAPRRSMATTGVRRRRTDREKVDPLTSREAEADGSRQRLPSWHSATATANNKYADFVRQLPGVISYLVGQRSEVPVSRWSCRQEPTRNGHV